MHWFWLTFDSAATERQYDAFRLNRWSRLLDSACLYMALAVDSAALVWWISSKSVWAGFPWIVHLMYTIWELRFRRRIEEQGLVDVRALLVCLRRSVHAALLILFITPDASFSINLLMLCIKTGIIWAIAPSILLLKFTHYAPLQMFFAVIFVFFATKGPCGEVMGSPTAASVISDIYEGVRMCSDLIMFAMTDVNPVVESTGNCPCMELVTWCHVFILTGCMALVLWFKERSGRIAFARYLPFERRMREGLDWIGEDSDLMILMLPLALPVAVGVGWKANRYLVRAVEFARRVMT